MSPAVERLAVATWLLSGAVLVARANPNLPAAPVHGENMEGHMHAHGTSTPFPCGDPATGERVTCPEDLRPEDADLSCDASGCHGSFEYDPSQNWADRALDGSGGPSCHTCHGTFWSSTM